MKNYILNIKQNDIYFMMILHTKGITIYTRNEKYFFKTKKGIYLDLKTFYYHYHDFYDEVRIQLNFYDFIKLPYHSFLGKGQGYLILFGKHYLISNADIYIEESKPYPLWIQAIHENILLHIHKDYFLKGYLKIDHTCYNLSLFLPYKDHYRYLNYHLYISIRQTHSYVSPLHLVLFKNNQKLIDITFKDTYIKI